MLKLINVSCKNSKNGANLLNNVTLEIRVGDYVVITGQNEKEQETLLEVLGAVRAPKVGEMYIDGIELTKHTPNQLTIMRRAKFGYILKCSELDGALTVGENVEFPLVFAGLEDEERKAKVERALNIVGLLAFKDLSVNSLTEWQKNKVLIARAIVGEPKVLILSEPCRVQDKTKLEEVISLLSALNRDGVTIVVASNNDEYFNKAKRRIALLGGTITEMKKERQPREGETKKPRTKKTTKKSDKKLVKVKEESADSEKEKVAEIKKEENKISSKRSQESEVSREIKAENKAKKTTTTVKTTKKKVEKTEQNSSDETKTDKPKSTRKKGE